MTITEAEVRHVATLARLALSDEEVQRYSQDLSNILHLVEKLNTLNLDAVDENEATTVVVSPIDGHSVADFRSDVANRRFTRDALLANAPEAEDGFFRVPRILEE